MNGNMETEEVFLKIGIENIDSANIGKDPLLVNVKIISIVSFFRELPLLPSRGLRF